MFSHKNSKISTSSAALDLAHLSQTSPRTHFAVRTLETREKSSEWPQFMGANRGPENMPARSDRRTVTNPNLTLSTPTDDIPSKAIGNTVSASATPLLQTQTSGHSHNQTPASRRGSPHSLMDGLSATTRSVPTTPLGVSGLAAHLLQAPGTPLVADVQNMNGRITTPGLHVNDSPVNANDLQASLSRLSQGYEHGSLTFNSIQNVAHDDVCTNNYSNFFSNIYLLMQYGMESPYNLGGSTENSRYNSYDFESNNSANSTSVNNGSAALYHHNNPRYGVGLPGRGGTSAAVDGKMNGLHGPKHKRGDIDRECQYSAFVLIQFLLFTNRKQSIDLLAPGSKIYKEKSQPCVKINTAVATFRRN